MRLACCRVTLLALALLTATRCADRRPADSTAAGPAVIESASSENCAAQLSLEATSIYRISAPDMNRDTDLPSLLRERVMSMVLRAHPELSESGSMRLSRSRIPVA